MSARAGRSTTTSEHSSRSIPLLLTDIDLSSTSSTFASFGTIVGGSDPGGHDTGVEVEWALETHHLICLFLIVAILMGILIALTVKLIA